MAETEYHGWPLPDGTDLPFVHLDMKALADAVDKELPVVVANWAAMQALPPILNLKALVATLNYRLFVHNGTTWVAQVSSVRTNVKDNSAIFGNATGVKAKIASGEIEMLHFVGTEVTTTDASGYIGLTLPETVTGMFSGIVNNGDSNQGRGDIYSVAGSPFTHNANTLYISVVDSAGAAKASATVRYNYDIWGWKV